MHRYLSKHISRCTTHKKLKEELLKIMKFAHNYGRITFCNQLHINDTVTLEMHELVRY